jgi:hypothetical protein
MIRDQLLFALDRTPGGFSTEALAGKVGIDSSPATLATLDALLMLSSETIREGDHWRLIGKSRTAKILSAIESYAITTGKKIFRLSSALEGLPAHEHPTEEELLRTVQSSNGRYQLLRNAMIKRNA